MAAKTVLKDVTGANQFTDALELVGGAQMIIRDTSSMSMTVTLQTRAPGQSNWVDSDEQSAEGAWPITTTAGADYRLGVKTGAWVSGTCTVYLTGN